jgi:hypothetical protein
MHTTRIHLTRCCNLRHSKFIVLYFLSENPVVNRNLYGFTCSQQIETWDKVQDHTTPVQPVQGPELLSNINMQRQANKSF